jgi:hypothetical protein
MRSNREEVLRANLERAKTQAQKASESFIDMIRGIPSGIPHPDGSLRVQQAANEQRRAMAALNQALHRLTEFLVERTIPDVDVDRVRRDPVDGSAVDPNIGPPDFRFPQSTFPRSESEVFYRQEHEPEAATPVTGMYTCIVCGHRIVSERGVPLPPETRHCHANGPQVRWKFSP